MVEVRAIGWAWRAHRDPVLTRTLNFKDAPEAPLRENVCGDDLNRSVHDKMCASVGGCGCRCRGSL